MEILGLVDIPLWLMLVLTLLLLLYVYGTWNHSVWASQGVPGPKPWPLLGNTRELLEKSHFKVFQEWQAKYGRAVGYYRGVRPVLAITDLDMVQEVMLKQFNNFSERNIPRGATGLIEKSVFFAWGPTWKRIRSLMTPAFTGVKLKLMSHYVNRCSDLLAKNIERKASSGELIDVKHMCQAFTLDVIAGTGFGLETNSLSQEDEPFTRHCRELFANAGARGLLRALVYLASAFPLFGPLQRKVGIGRGSSFFRIALEKMVDERLERKNHPSQKSGKPQDILQMLTDSEADPELITACDNSDETKSYRRMTKEEIMSQGFILLLAGFETTATTLQYLTYNLALHPHVQERIFEEIREQLGDAEPAYENVSKLKYLDAAIRESLRMFSPLGTVDRKAKEPVTIKGVHIPADCGITIPIYSILRDPEYFPDPDVFNPDRFLEENVSKIHPVAAELVFGYGPRKCLGMRLALLEIKTVAIIMLRRCRFVKCAETPDKVQLGKALNLAMADKVIKVKAELRSA